HAAILRRSNGSCIVWDVATLAQGVETPLDKHVVALQPFVCSRGSLGSVYRHEVKTVLSTDQHARLVQSTCKLMQHQMSGPGPSIVVDAPLPDQTLKSNATAINTRLHAITMLVRQHLEVQTKRLSWFDLFCAQRSRLGGGHCRSYTAFKCKRLPWILSSMPANRYCTLAYTFVMTWHNVVFALDMAVMDSNSHS
ncbi:hypothetical protein AaE_003571, partial [Aphanomyces astaci]